MGKKFRRRLLLVHGMFPKPESGGWHASAVEGDTFSNHKLP